jgi:large subunit ribosomal protein L27
MAHKKGVGSSDNGRDSKSKRLGVKRFAGQHATAGNILIRQRGTRYGAGENTYYGKDHTVHARIDGVVAFKKGKNDKTIIFIKGYEAVSEVLDAPKAATVTATAAAAAPKAPAATATAAVNNGGDDLKKMEGIGPKIEEILKNGGIVTFADLANSNADAVRELLSAAGPRYNSHDPGTWAAQAALARDGKWDELKKWQDELDGGK